MTPDSISQASRPDLRSARRRAPATPTARAPQPISAGGGRRARLARARRAVGVMGAAAALPFFVWLPLGWLEVVPSMVDVFGAVGLRTPAGITVSGLLLAAIGFYDD